MRTFLKLQLFLLIVIIASVPARSQTTVGFTDPDSIQAVIDYRLPTWGYSNFYLTGSSANLRKRITNQDQSNRQSGPLLNYSSIHTDRNSYDLDFRATYQYYRESDKFLLDFEAYPEVFTDKLRSTTDRSDHSGGVPSETTFDQHVRTWYGGLGSDFSGHYYTKHDLFASFDFFGSYNYTNRLQEYDQDGTRVTDRTNLNRTAIFRPELGIGIGRVRNVTPQIRALRLNERLQQFDLESNSTTELIDLAQEISKRGRYNQMYDRPDKYFWNEVNTLLGNRLDNISSFDAFYLEDVFNESLGARFEGYEVRLSARYTYTNQLSKDLDGDDQTLMRTLEIVRYVTPQISAFWSKNYTLEHQVSASVNTAGIFPLEQRIYTEWISYIGADIEWLWNIADKSILTTTLTEQFQQEFFKDRTPNDDLNVAHEGALSFTYTRFLENKLRLSANFTIVNSYGRNRIDSYDLESDAWDFRLGGNITYFFFRSIY